MTRRIFWRSRAVTEATPAFGRKWWRIIGTLGAVGATLYLLPSLAERGHIGGAHLPGAVDTQHGPDSIPIGGGAPFKPSFLSEETWRSLPLFALQSSSEIPVASTVQLNALQAAYERERNSAADAQLQVAALQEQLANLREKQEEVLVLREQLADAKAHAEQRAELRSAETEKDERNALLRAAALQEELANLTTEVLKAKATAEGEKVRAASALAQLEAVQHQLAVATAARGDVSETERHLRPEDDGTAARPPLTSPRPIGTADRDYNLPLPLEANQGSSFKQRQGGPRNLRPDQSVKAMGDKPRQALPRKEDNPLAGPANKTASAPVRAVVPGGPRLTRPRHEPTNQNVLSLGKPAQRASQQSRMLAQETRNRRDPGALSLPSDLLPDSRLW